MTNPSFADVVRARHSARRFLPDPVDALQIQALLEDAQCAPSNANTQPWRVHIISGRTRDMVSTALLKAASQQHYSPDFSWDEHAYTGIHAQRRQEQGKTFYKALGIAREDKEARTEVFRHNLEFYGAPHVAFLFMPLVGDGVRVASDIGMYAQNFLLSLTARGLAGVPQTLLGMFADPVREILGVGDDMKLLFGISFGYADASALSASVRIERAPLTESVQLHN